MPLFPSRRPSVGDVVVASPFMLSLAFPAGAFAETTALAPTSGDGKTSATPYQIASLANLRWLSEESSAADAATYCGGCRITNSYATGTASAVSSGDYVHAGGLVGYDRVEDGYSLLITNCYAAGSATNIISSASRSALGGGLVGGGNRCSDITASYWNVETSGNLVACLSCYSLDPNAEKDLGLVGWSSTGMRKSAKSDKLDFASTWFQYDGQTYPLLRVFMTPLTVTAKDSVRTCDGKAFSRGNGFQSSRSSVVDSLVKGTPTYGGTSQGAKNAGSNYDATFHGATFRVRTPASLGNRPVGMPVSHELAVRPLRAMASVARGTARGSLEAGTVGENDLSVDVLLPGAASVDVSIFDNLGTPVISWSRDVSAFDVRRLAPSGDGRAVLPVRWNLRSRDGQPVPSGVYLWKISVVDALGQKSESIVKLGVK